MWALHVAQMTDGISTVILCFFPCVIFGDFFLVFEISSCFILFISSSFLRSPLVFFQFVYLPTCVPSFLISFFSRTRCSVLGWLEEIQNLNSLCFLVACALTS